MCLHENGLTDFMFKELLKRNRDFLLLLINGICNLNLTLDDFIFGDSEDRDSSTYKTINYDIKVESINLNLDIEAQKKIVDRKLNSNLEYDYDINRAIYYLSLLHSRSYDYKEKGYKKKKSIVVFLYEYDIPGDDIIQKTNLHNQTTKVEYDNIIYYSVSIAKIEENSKIELYRALKLLSELDIEVYKNDESEVIRRAANMLEGYDKTEIAAMMRDAKRKEEYEKGIELQAAEDRGEAKAIRSSIITMSKNGFDNETIAKALSLDINYVNEVLNK